MSSRKRLSETAPKQGKRSKTVESSDSDSDSSIELARPRTRSRSKRAAPPQPEPVKKQKETAVIKLPDLDSLRLNPTYTVGVIDLFCGCGGFSAGAFLGGMQIIAGFDNEETKLAIYREQFGTDKGINHTIEDADRLMEKVEEQVAQSQFKKVHIHASPVCVKMSQAINLAGKQQKCDGPNISQATWNTTITFLKMCVDKDWFFSYSIEDAPQVEKDELYMQPLKQLENKLKEKHPQNKQHNTIVEASKYGLASSRKRFYSVWCKDKETGGIAGSPFYAIQSDRNLSQYSQLLKRQVSDEEIPPTGPVTMEKAFKLYGLDIDDEKYWGIHGRTAQTTQVFLSMPLDETKSFEELPVDSKTKEQGYIYNLTRLYGLDNVATTICTNKFPRQWIYINNPIGIKWPKARGTKGKNRREEISEKEEIYRVGPIEHNKAISIYEKAESFPRPFLTGDEFKALLGFPKDFPDIDGDCAGDSVPPLISMMIASHYSRSWLVHRVYETTEDHEQASLFLMKYIYETSLTKATVINLFDEYLKTNTKALRTRKLYLRNIKKWMDSDIIVDGKRVEVNNFIIDIEKGGAANDLNHRQLSAAMLHFSNFRQTDAFKNWMNENCTYVLDKFDIKTKAQLNTWRLKLHPDKALKSDTQFWVFGEEIVATTEALNEIARKKGTVLKVHRYIDGQKQPDDINQYTEFIPMQWQEHLFNYVEKCFKALNQHDSDIEMLDASDEEKDVDFRVIMKQIADMVPIQASGHCATCVILEGLKRVGIPEDKINQVSDSRVFTGAGPVIVPKKAYEYMLAQYQADPREDLVDNVQQRLKDLSEGRAEPSNWIGLDELNVLLLQPLLNDVPLRILSVNESGKAEIIKTNACPREVQLCKQFIIHFDGAHFTLYTLKRQYDHVNLHDLRKEKQLPIVDEVSSEDESMYYDSGGSLSASQHMYYDSGGSASEDSSSQIVVDSLPELDTKKVNEHMIYENGQWFVDSKIFNIEGFKIPIIDFYMTYTDEKHGPRFQKDKEKTLLIITNRLEPVFDAKRPTYVSQKDHARYTFLNKMLTALSQYSIFLDKKRDGASGRA